MTMIYILFIFIILYMEFVRLVDYVKEWELFEKIDWEYAQIVSDYDFNDVDFVRINRISDLKKLRELNDLHYDEKVELLRLRTNENICSEMVGQTDLLYDLLQKMIQNIL